MPGDAPFIEALPELLWSGADPLGLHDAMPEGGQVIYTGGPDGEDIAERSGKGEDQRVEL
jgi:hypothetical protein